MQPHFIKLLLAAVHVLPVVSGNGQTTASISDSLYKIAESQTLSKHFALLYYQSTLQANRYMVTQSPACTQFLTAFTNRFATYFFAAAENEQQSIAQSFSWQRYYSHSRLNPFQYYFIGMNAHINGDMWQALVQTQTYDSIKKYKRPLLIFQQSLDDLFDSTYSACRQFKKFNRMHRFTLGLGKWYGKKMLLRWRKKQVRLAMLYYSNTAAFTRRLAKTKRRMKRLDAFVIKWLA